VLYLLNTEKFAHKGFPLSGQGGYQGYGGGYGGAGVSYVEQGDRYGPSFGDAGAGSFGGAWGVSARVHELGSTDVHAVNGGNNELWASQGYPVSGPNGWVRYILQETGEPYYHNSSTGETVWDKPLEWV
jgi:WW domain